MNNYIVTALTGILNTYQSIVAYFYQRIIQVQYTNNVLATYVINYNLLLPSSEFVFNLNENQVNAQIQTYINECNALIAYINLNPTTQTTLLYEQIQNILNDSITQLNGFSISLLQAKYNSIFSYTIPYNMSMTNALFLNNISLDTSALQISLNYGIQDFNNILQNSVITLSRGE